MTAGPILDLASFSAALRSRGLTVTPDQMAEMAHVFALVDASSRSQVHAGLRSLAIADPDQRPAFDEEFERFFGLPDVLVDGADDETAPPASMSEMKPIIQGAGDGSEEDVSSQGGASDVETLGERDFADLDEHQLAEARRLIMGMAWEPSDTRTRRWVSSRTGPLPDLRRTLRRSVRPDGDLMLVVRKDRRLRQRPLIVIADISGSMDKYAEMFMVFAHTARRRVRSVEAFTFSTELTRITDDLSRRDIRSSLDSISASVQDWSGGTRIGNAIGAWNRDWSRRLARGGPVVLILSDGWDTGDPVVLDREMARLSRSVHRVFWLNPLAGRESYEPATVGMRTAMPYVDDLLPAASVQDLRGVVRLLDTIGVRNG